MIFLIIKKNVKQIKGKCIVLFYIGRNITALLYFFVITLFNKKVVIHFKQSEPGYLILLKNIFKNKMIFITDLEGDKIFENDFILKSKINQVSPQIGNEIEDEELIRKEKNKLNSYDYVFVYNEFFQNVLQLRHNNLKCKIIVSHLMSFKKDSLFFDNYLRLKFKEKLPWNDEPVLTYIGNIYYPWQNLSKTIRLYKKIKNEINPNFKLLLLINKQDHLKAMDFIEINNLNSSDYYLAEVPNNEIVGYLNASDIGIVLRDFHPMNKVVTSGKLLDYLGCGLPVITTSVLLNFPKNVEIIDIGLILNNLNIEKISKENIENVFKFNLTDRKNISTWANENLSLDNLSQAYIQTLIKIS